MSLNFDSARLPNPDLTEEHHAWRDQLRRFIDREIMPYVDEWDAAVELTGMYSQRVMGWVIPNLATIHSQTALCFD